MKLEITASEAWEAVERLGADVIYNSRLNEWYVVAGKTQSSKFEQGCGPTPIDAVAQLLERIGETATIRAEVANA